MTPQQIRQARTARIRLIRRRIAAGAVTLFIAVWALIAVVLVTGHDPALAGKTATASTTTAGSSGTSSGTTAGTSSSAVSSVTTSQS
jgi:hypothetical protein